MQSQQQQTKRRKPHYSLCVGRYTPPTITITLDEAKQHLEEQKLKAKELAKQFCVKHPSIFNAPCIKNAKKLWKVGNFDDYSPSEKLTYLAQIEILEILSDAYQRAKFRERNEEFYKQEILAQS